MNCLKKINLTGIFSASQKITFNFKSPTFLSLKPNVSRGISGYVYDQNPVELSESDKTVTKDILSKVNNQITEKTHGRLFAIIQFGERRFKITNEDIIALNTYFPANIGDRIRLEKILAVGSSDFTLLGRPVLSKDLVRIEATVIEKTYIIPRPLYRHGRLRYTRLHWFRTPYVLFRINSIDFTNSLDTLPAVENVQNRVIY